jgi:hypothetical protein
MPRNLLDIIPGVVNRVMGNRVFKPATLIVDGPATGPSYDPTPGVPVEYKCQVLEDSWSAYSQAGGLVSSADRKLLIIAKSLPSDVVPVEGNRVRVNGKTFSIVSDGGSAPAVATDPAYAIWTCRGRA